MCFSQGVQHLTLEERMQLQEKVRKIAPRLMLLMLLGISLLASAPSPRAEGSGSGGPFPVSDSTKATADTTGTDTLPPSFQL